MSENGCSENPQFDIGTQLEPELRSSTFLSGKV